MKILKMINKYLLFIYTILFIVTWSLSVVYSYSLDPILSLNTLSMGFGIMMILLYMKELTKEE